MGFLKYALKRLSASLHEQRSRWRLQRANPTLYMEANVQIKSPERLTVGGHVVIQRNTIIHCGGMDWCRHQGRVRLEDQVTIGPGCVLYGAGEISIGPHTHLGPGVKILSQSGDPAKPHMSSDAPLIFKPITIGKGCWIGAGAVILEGTVLGDCCTIGPNSTVKGTYRDHSTLIGNPARPAPNFSPSFRRNGNENDR